MGLKMNKILYSNLLDIASEFTLRVDFGFVEMNQRLTTDEYYTFDDLFSIVDDEDVVDIVSLESFFYAEIGNTNCYNQVFPYMLSWDEQNEFNEPIFKKISKGDIINVEPGDILISKVRPYLKKFIFITEELSNVYFTSAFIHIRPRSNNKILYYALKSIFLLNLMAIARQGKGYPTISAKDLKSLKFKKEHIDKLSESSNALTNKLVAVETKITNLYDSLKSINEIVNTVFLKYIGISRKDIKSGYKKTYNLSVQELDSYDIRTSVRYNNPKYHYLNNCIFQEQSFSDFIDSEKTSLGRQMSPDFIEEDSDVFYINTNSIQLTGFIDSALTPISFDFYKKNQKLKVDKGDILLIASGEGSIGRTCIFDSDVDCITSQFIMKLHPKEGTDIVYLNFFMHSLYFQFCIEKYKKGKGNMTNIFVSQLLDFPLYYPQKETREKIVREISEAISKRNKCLAKIDSLRNEINSFFDEVLN